MLCNSEVTIYHRNGLDPATHLEMWQRYNYNNTWFFGGKGIRFNKGLDDANDVSIRIPYDENEGLNFDNFSVGDIIVEGNLDVDIETQQDLKGYLVYNITSLNNNNFGHNKHIHIGGK